MPVLLNGSNRQNALINLVLAEVLIFTVSVIVLPILRQRRSRRFRDGCRPFRVAFLFASNHCVGHFDIGGDITDFMRMAPPD
jgi:hypothetical protein